MTIIKPCYTTREQVKKTTDVKTVAYLDDLVDTVIEDASREVEAFCHRIFYPRYETKYFPWPDYDMRTYYRLWLDDQELISVSSLLSGGSSIASNLYFLEPVNIGPPFYSLEINIGVASPSAAFTVGATYQRNIAITGLWGFADDSSNTGTLASDILSNDETLIISNSAKVGVGDLIQIDDERLLVTDKSSVSTGDTLQTALTASIANDSVNVSNGTNFNNQEIITIDSERMLIIAIIGNTLNVKRAYDGSVLATHTGSTIYAPRALSVSRGQVGTAADSHPEGVTILRYEPPRPVQELATSYAVKLLLDRQSGYVSSAGRNSRGSGTTSKGSNPTGSGTSGTAIGGLEERLKRSKYVRKGRIFAI